MPTEPTVPSPPLPTPPAPPGKRRWLLFGCGGLLAFLLIIVATVAITIWWIQRPIKPVVLTPKEKAAVETKLQEVEDSKGAARTAGGTRTDAGDRRAPGSANRPTVQPYVAGAKEIRFTQRELNGLLNQNTDLGKTVRLEFAQDAVNAYLAVPIPQDFPIMGGKMFRARGQFLISIGNGGTPFAVLQDVTIFGVSLPKAWLGGIKGENLLEDAVGQGKRGPILKGIKSLRVEPGALVLELED